MSDKDTEARLSSLRVEVCKANKLLPETGLVTMHSGNASGYDPESGLLVIKPSGMDYDRITPECLVQVCVETGEIVDNGLRPSVDLPHHLYLYRNVPGVRGIIHTHSNYATAFAAVGRPVPLVLTAIADEFGAEIPCAPYVDNEDEHIGEAILKYRNRSPAILMGNHGVFAWGDSPKSALKAAVMTEDVAKTVWLAMQIGDPKVIPTEEAEKWYDRYHNRYGQTK
ncbi:MAG: L-ribulose-5-phosphate 4-epimerase [Fimbriimonas sp.]|nr:L-ribulose-5-phosphate 4-epimerase [Fimbriimonas sp.]